MSLFLISEHKKNHAKNTKYRIMRDRFSRTAALMTAALLLFFACCGSAAAKETPVPDWLVIFEEEPAGTVMPTATPSPAPTAAPTATSTATASATETPAPNWLRPEETEWARPSWLFTPEPPADRVDRPSPAPTPVPDVDLIDHVNQPGLLPGFYFRKDAKILHIWIPNIRDADEAVLLFENQVYMIDCGDDRSGTKGAAMLRYLGVDHVDLMFNSHLHHDHINGLDETDDAARVSALRICFPADSTESGMKMSADCYARNIPVSQFRHGDVYTMGTAGEVTLTFWKNQDPALDVNNQSAVTMVQYGERTMLFTADMEKAGQEALLKLIDPSLLRCDILKYPHHAKSALSESFYEATGASLAVVTSVQGRDDAGQRYLSLKRMPTIFTSDKYTHLATDGTYWLVEAVTPVQ